MQRSYLVQRLQKPFPKDRKGPFANHPNLFSFGGGLKNGGLSDDAMSLIRDIFRFDYMGAAEFEFGAVPEALQKIARSKDNTSFEVCVKTKSGSTGPVYVICSKADVDEISNRITAWAKDPYSKNAQHTKETVGLNRVIDGEKYPDCCGWLELDNGYFFFTDAEMFSKTCGLFGVKNDTSQNAA